MQSTHQINRNTGVKQKFNAIKNSYSLDKILRLKEFSSNKIVKYNNKLSLKLYNASSSSKSFWIMISNPILKFFHKCGMVIAQFFIDVFAVPCIRLKMLMCDK